MKVKTLFDVLKTFTQKNSPYILSGAGAVAILGGSVVLIKKTRNAIMKKSDPDGRTFEEKISDEIAEARYTSEEEKNGKAITKAYLKSAVKYTAYYASPILLISGGVACMISAMLIQTRRLRAMSAAYTALAAAYNSYRERVKAVVGEEKENDIFNGVERDEKGNIIKTASTVDEKYKENTKEFSRLFGDGNSVFWTKQTELCVFTITSAESNLNNLLRDQGFVTLNDVWKELGMRPSEEGMYVGWRWKYGDPVYGSTYIDLGLSGPKNARKREELNGMWNEEIWINVIPPHTLFGKLPKEIIRNKDERERITRNRKRLILEEY